MCFQGNGDKRIHKNLCFIDVETTGTVFGFHEIIDVACIRIGLENSDVKACWERRIRPREPGRITTIAREINGFSIEEWASAEESSEALWEEFASVVRGCVPVCHNPSFDRAFICLEAAAHGATNLGLDYHWIGTESLAWPLYLSGRLKTLSLFDLCDYFGLPSESKPHRAMNGAKTCWDVYLALVELFPVR